MRTLNQGTTDNGFTALMFASENGDADVVKLLLAQEGVDVNQVETDDGWTALMVASENGHADVVALLLAHEGVEDWISSKSAGKTALGYASSSAVRGLLTKAIEKRKGALLTLRNGVRSKRVLGCVHDCKTTFSFREGPIPW